MAENPGEYNRRIMIQTRVTGRTPAGAPLAIWENLIPLWAKYRGETGMATIRREADHLGVMNSPVRCSWRIRHRSTITSDMRVVHRGKVYDILRVQHDEANREWTDLVCEEGANAG